MFENDVWSQLQDKAFQLSIEVAHGRLAFPFDDLDDNFLADNSRSVLLDNLRTP